MTTICSSPVPGGNEGIGYDNWSQTPHNRYVNRFFSMVLLSLIVISCNDNSLDTHTEQIIEGQMLTITASWANDSGTRTVLQSDGTTIYWSPGESINAFYGNKFSGKFISNNTQPKALTTFSGTLTVTTGSIESGNESSDYWAVYPYDSSNTCDGSSVTLTVPTRQSSIAGSFANNTFPAVATGKTPDLAFYNVCGGVRFSVTQEGIKSIVFKAGNNESLTGKVQVAVSNGKPYVKSVIDGADSLVVMAPTGGFVPGSYYFAAIIPQTLTKGLSMYLYKDMTSASTEKSNSIVVNRSRFGMIDNIDEGLSFSNNIGEDNIVFADDRIKAKLVAAFDTNSDGEISYGEAAAVTSIKGVFSAIKTYQSFDEFQYFTGVTAVPDSMFALWNLMTSITLPSSIQAIGKCSFKGCVKLNKVVIPTGVTTIGWYAFSGCTSLTSVTIPESVTTIGWYAFSNCTSLTSVTIPESVSMISESAFSFCTSLTSVTIPESVTAIYGSTFRGCTSLTSVTIPESVTTIGESAFMNCSSLTSVTIPESVTTIGWQAFYECRNLTAYLSLGKGATIQSNAFAYCDSLVLSIREIVRIDRICKNTPCRLIMLDDITIINNNAFNGDSCLVSVTIPESVTTIGQQAFYECRNLTSVTIPESVSMIGKSAFSFCTSLTSVTIPESVSTISESAFSGCTSLTSVTIPKSVTTINQYAFRGCTSLTSVTIPESVTSIYRQAFYNCTGLTSVTILPLTPPSCGTYNFEYTNNCPLYVPSQSVEAYKNADGWKQYADRIQAISN